MQIYHLEVILLSMRLHHFEIIAFFHWLSFVVLVYNLHASKLSKGYVTGISFDTF